MIKIKNLFLSLVAISTVLALSCGGGGGGGDDTPTPTPAEQRLIDLGGSSGITWVPTSVTQDGAPANGFETFSITIRGTEASKTYSTTDSETLLSSSGTWDFNGTNLNQLIFDGDSDNVWVISNLNADATPATVTLTVNYTADGGAAAGSSGTYVFNLQEQ